MMSGGLDSELVAQAFVDELLQVFDCTTKLKFTFLLLCDKLYLFGVIRTMIVN